MFPSGCIPNISISRPTDATPKKQKKKKTERGFLEPPKWRYKEAKEVKKEKKAEKNKDGKEKEKKHKKDSKKTKK